MFKFFRKKKLEVFPPEVQSAIDAEYNALYGQKRNNLIKLFGDDYKEVYGQWFDEEMQQAYREIRDKYMKEYQRNKARKNQKEKEML